MWKNFSKLCLFPYSFNKHFLGNCYVTGSALGTGDRAGNKTDKYLCLHGVYILELEDEQ